MTKLASSHYLQSDQWAELRKATGWQILNLSLERGQIVHAYRKKTPLGGVVYVPGFQPDKPEHLKQLASQLRETGAMTCKIEPCVPTNEATVKVFHAAGWRPARHVQYAYTVRLDLAQPKDDLWMGLKSRCRQEIKYAKRDGVKIEESSGSQQDFETMHELLKDTSTRKSFGIREKRGVLNFWRAFHEAGRLRLFFAKHEGKIIAGGVFISDGKSTVWYKDAGSLPAYGKLFGPRLLLWEAALAFQKDGFKTFDLGGTTSPADYESSPMKGVYIFKTAFARELTTMMPTFELALKPVRHALWQKLEPSAVKLNRLASTIKGKIK